MEDNSLENALKVLESVQSSESLIKSLEIVDELKVSSYLSSRKIRYSNEPSSWKSSCSLFYLVSSVMDVVDLNSQEISRILSINQLNSIVHAVQECATNSLEVCVKKQQNRTTYNVTNQSEDEYRRLVGSLRMFHKFFSIKIVSSNHLFDDAKLDYIIGLLAVISLKKNAEDVTEFLNIFATITSVFPIDLVFKFLMMMRGFNLLSKDFQLLVHREMMRMIRSPNGFHVLCRNLLVNPNDSQVPIWQKYSMISKIIEAVVAHKAYQQFMVDEIFKTLDVSVKRDDREVIGACAFVLKNFEAKDELRSLVHVKVLEPLKSLVSPEDVLCGSIVMELEKVKEFIAKLQILFSPSSVASLPSIILKQHIGVLFNLYCIIPDSPEKEKLAGVIIFFLSNRDKKELQKFVKDLRFNEASIKINPRIVFKNDSLQIAGESPGIFDSAEPFLNLFKNSNNNFLIYDVFLSLINILSDVQDNFLTPYNVDDEDLPEILHRKFFKKLAILEPLQEMIQWKSLQSQLNEKPKEVLEVVKAALEKSDSMDEQLTVIFFSIFKELTGKLRDEAEKKKMTQEIHRIKEKIKNKNVREQIEAIFAVSEEIPSVDPSKIVFDDALKLLKSKEVYMKVYGSDTLLKLLKKRDKQALSNRHTILAVALENLKEKESYAYLNIIRLLVVLSYVMDTEVIDALIAEYKNNELEIDERLKIGEVIVKVTEDLREMSMKFKEQLINCFLKGSRDVNNEFRTSSLVNLGTVCKLLSFQIHNFFQEMFQQIEIIVKTDDYLPSKRAAAMVLSQILAGLPNLMDFQDFLLPIYHLLKEILSNEADEQTKLHAGVALDHLNSKTKDFLNPDLKMAKEIKIRLDENPHKIDEIKFK